MAWSIHQRFPIVVLIVLVAVAVGAIKSKSRTALEGLELLEDKSLNETHTTERRPSGGPTGWDTAREAMGLVKDLSSGVVDRVKQHAADISKGGCEEDTTDPELQKIVACENPQDDKELVKKWPQGESRRGLRPPWTMHLIQRPKGKRSMGTWQAWCYTSEQQKCLGITEQGYCPGEGSLWPDFSNGRPLCHSASPSGKGDHELLKGSGDHDQRAQQAQDANPSDVESLHEVLDRHSARSKLMSVSAHRDRSSHEKTRERDEEPNTQITDDYVASLQLNKEHMESFFDWYNQDRSHTLEFAEVLSLIQEMRDSYAIPFDMQFKLRGLVISFDTDSDKQDDLDKDEFADFTQAALNGRLPEIFEDS